jgi:predicted RNA-binding Zn-ribbon protein involved in translation (DUF1610 family)
MYDHKKTVDSLSEEEYKGNLRKALDAYRYAKKHNKAICETCKREIDLASVYRCYYCGLYFCRRCAKIHFE